MPHSLVALSALRWVTALGLVVVPTMAMGATLPLLSRSLDSGEHSIEATTARERRLGALYALNTLGGALGALAAAYLILPALGVDGSVFRLGRRQCAGRALGPDLRRPLADRSEPSPGKRSERA